MKDDKTKRFVTRICEKTQGSELTWEKTANGDEFLTRIHGYIITFTKKEQNNNATVYVITLFNSDGEVIDAYDDEDFEPPEIASRAGSFFKFMEAAFSTARRQAMGVEKALDDILDHLS